MTIHEFKLPDLAEGTTEGEIVAWHVKPGGTIKEDDPLVDVMTDKAVVEIPSPVTGVATTLRAAVGDKVAVGSTLVVFEVGVAVVAAVAPPAPAAPTAPAGQADDNRVVPAAQWASQSSATQVAPDSAVEPGLLGRPKASPSVRRRAREADVSLAAIRGSGPAGRILHADLDAALNGHFPAADQATGTAASDFSSTRQPAPASPGSSVARPTASSATRPEFEDMPIVGMRRMIAQRMAQSKSTIPHFAYVEEIDVTDLEALRQHLNSRVKDKQTRLTPLPFIMLALVRVLPAYPDINATFDTESFILRRHRGIHIGIATQTPAGLMVPVVRHAERRNLWDCAAELVRVSAAAREGRATRADLVGSTITLTSLGPLGGVAATPIINHPEVAIIGPNRIVERPVVRGGQIVIRKMMNLSASFDHRIVDGYVAAEFVQRMKSLLEMPAMLFIENR